MAFFKKKQYKKLSEYGDKWAVAEGELNGNPISTRYRESFKQAVGHPEYPYQIGIAIPLIDQTDNGLPSKSESDILYTIEDTLTSALSSDAEFVMSISTAGMRELVFYAKEWKPEDIESKVNDVADGLKPYEIQFMMKPDPKWKTFSSLVA